MCFAATNALDFCRRGENRANYNCSAPGKAISDGAIDEGHRRKLVALTSFSALTELPGNSYNHSLSLEGGGLCTR